MTLMGTRSCSPPTETRTTPLSPRRPDDDPACSSSSGPAVVSDAPFARGDGGGSLRCPVEGDNGSSILGPCRLSNVTVVHVGFQVSCAVVHYRCAHCPTTPAPIRRRVLLVSLARPSHACFPPPQDHRYSPPLPPIRGDRRRVRETFCRIGAGFLGQSAHLARNSLPFHT